MDATKIGYEISFGRYIYKPTPLRTVEQIRTDILKLEQQTEGLLHKIVGAAQMADKKFPTGHWCIGMPPAEMAEFEKKWGSRKEMGVSPTLIIL
jgi:hypothetical protein